MFYLIFSLCGIPGLQLITGSFIWHVRIRKIRIGLGQVFFSYKSVAYLIQTSLAIPELSLFCAVLWCLLELTRPKSEEDQIPINLKKKSNVPGLQKLLVNVSLQLLTSGWIRLVLCCLGQQNMNGYYFLKITYYKFMTRDFGIQTFSPVFLNWNRNDSESSHYSNIVIALLHMYLDNSVVSYEIKLFTFWQSTVKENKIFLKVSSREISNLVVPYLYN